MKGYTAQEIIGQHFSRFYMPDDVRSGHPQHELEIAAASGRYEEEGWRVRKDGSRFWANVVITALRDETGKLRGFGKVTRDMTERRQAEQRLLELNQALEHRVAERTRELEAFAYSVSHDLRAPLRAMEGFARALLEDYGDKLEETGRVYAGEIVEAAREMEELVEDLLTYSRLSQADIRPERVDLAEIIDDAAQHLIPEVEDRGGRIEVEAPFPPALGHRATLVQAVQNLLANAIKFAKDGVPPRVRVYAQRRDGRVRLVVEDDGIGIAPEHHERIFNVFERLHGSEKYPGTGIGLAIVRKAVERMGGTVGVESALGSGSRFWIELPLPD